MTTSSERAAFAQDFTAWFDAQEMTMSALAATVGTNRVSIRHWLTGRTFPRDEFCAELYRASGQILECFGPGRDEARAAHERSIPAEVKKQRREKYEANPELYRGRALDTWRKRTAAKRIFVSADDLTALRADPRKRKNVCRECGQVLLDVGPHLWPAHKIKVGEYKRKYGFLRSRNATRSGETNQKQSVSMKRSGHQPPKETHAFLSLAHEASIKTNRPGSARLEERLDARDRKLAARPLQWKRTAAGDVVRDARIASLRLRDGLSVEEIAERVGMTVTPVFFRLRRMHLPRRARVFLHGEVVRARHLRSLGSDFGLTKKQVADLMGVTYDWFTSAAKVRAEEPALSVKLGHAYLKARRVLIRKLRTQPATSRGGRPKQLPNSERAEIASKYDALLADLQAVRRRVRAQDGRLSLIGFWDWLCGEFRARRFRVLHRWPAFFDWTEKGYESREFLSGSWSPNRLAREFLADDYDVNEDLIGHALTHHRT